MQQPTHRPEGAPRALAALLLANLVASVLHFGDNMLHFAEYPEPRWISGPHVVDALWLAITPLLAAGWWLARRGRSRAAVAVLWTYGVCGLFVLGHYLYAPPWALPFRINLLIGLEAAAAAVLIVLAPASVRAAAAATSGRAATRAAG